MFAMLSLPKLVYGTTHEAESAAPLKHPLVFLPTFVFFFRGGGGD